MSSLQCLSDFVISGLCWSCAFSVYILDRRSVHTVLSCERYNCWVVCIMASLSIGDIDWRGHLSRKEGGGSSCISDNCTFTLCMSSHHAPTRAHFTAEQATLCARLLPTGFFRLISFALCVINTLNTQSKTSYIQFQA